MWAKTPLILPRIINGIFDNHQDIWQLSVEAEFYRPCQIEFLRGSELGGLAVWRENHKFQLCNIRQDMAVNGEIYIILCIHIRKVPGGLHLKTTQERE